MCKKCIRSCLISGIATWGFFALLLTLLGAYKPGINALWLTILVSIAICCCPLMDPDSAECCRSWLKNLLKNKKVAEKPKVQKKK